MENGSYDAAFEALRDCEWDQSASGLTLGQLAFLYNQLGYGEFKEPEARARKVYQLFIRSAKLGNEDAILALISEFKNGDSLLQVAPDVNVEQCLRLVMNTATKRILVLKIACPSKKNV